MIHVSNAFKQELVNDRRNYEVTATITLEDNTILNLTNANIIANGLSIEDAISSDTSFQALGGCVINSATLIINNRDDAFSEYDFQNARVVIFLQLLSERIRKGTYRVDKTAYNGFSITLTLLDYMENFDRPYSLSSLTYPATLDDIVRDACTHCGVTLNTPNFPHKNFVVNSAPTKESTTFRDVLKWAATIAGCFARCNTNGQLELKWFDTDSLEEFLEHTDGGSFDSSNPYSTGDNVDGGIFNPWNTGAVVDDGTFGSEPKIHYISSLYSQTVAIEDSVITGVRILVKSDIDSQSAINTYMEGQVGYVLEITDNGFITDTNAQKIVEWLGTQLIGLRFRQLTITHTNDPTIEAGDVGVVFDRKGNQYQILITRTSFKAYSKQTTVCASETVAKNTATQYSEATKLYVESRKQLVKVNNRLEDRQDELAQQLAEAGGLYKTEVEVTPGGATRIYYHNKPNLNESDIIMLFSDVGFTVSADGGDTWYGLTVNGELIASILTATGVNADWINTGELVISKTEQGVTKEMFYANVDTGVVRIVADSFSFATGETVDSIAQEYAGEKAKVFTTQPTPPYNVGDLWVQGSTGDILRCQTARSSGSYTNSDWTLASKYTDDTTANETKQHFWVDNNGVHIATIANDPSVEFNSLWNSTAGLLFRNGLNNLVKLALNGITFYDGTGNTESAILASFGTDGVQIGRDGSNKLNITSQNLVCKNKNGTTVFELHTGLGIIDIEEKIESYTGPAHYIDVTGGPSDDTDNILLPDDFLTAESADIFIEYGRLYGTSQKTINTYVYSFIPGTASEYVLVCDSYQRIWFSYDGNRHLIIHVYNVNGYESGTTAYYFEATELSYNVTERYPAFTLGTRAANDIVGSYSFRAGENNQASGTGALALGSNNNAQADDSFAGGNESETGASALGAFAYGRGVKVVGADSTAVGTYNVTNSNNAFAVGVGIDDEYREDAFWVDKNGDVGIVGALYASQSLPVNSKAKLFTTGNATEDNITVSANSASGTITIDLYKDGYTPLALRGLRINNATTSGTNAAACAAYSFRISGTNCICAIRNHSASDAKIKVIADVLYIAETAL